MLRSKIVVIKINIYQMRTLERFVVFCLMLFNLVNLIRNCNYTLYVINVITHALHFSSIVGERKKKLQIEIVVRVKRKLVVTVPYPFHLRDHSAAVLE